MNLLIDRMENPGARNVSPLMGSMKCSSKRRNRQHSNSFRGLNEYNNTFTTNKESKRVADARNNTNSLKTNGTSLQPPVVVRSSHSESTPTIAINDMAVETNKDPLLNDPSSNSSDKLEINFNSLFTKDFGINCNKGSRDVIKSDSDSDSDHLEFLGSNMSRKKEQSLHENLNVYSSAFGAKFSDFEFDTNSPSNLSLRRISDASSSAFSIVDDSDPTLLNTGIPSNNKFHQSHSDIHSVTNSPFQSHSQKKRSMSTNTFAGFNSNRAQTKRLVNQFLESTKDCSVFACSSELSKEESFINIASLNCKNKSNTNSNNDRLKGFGQSDNNLTFQNMLYQDLDNATKNTSSNIFFSDPSSVLLSSNAIANSSNSSISSNSPFEMDPRAKRNLSASSSATTPSSSFATLNEGVELKTGHIPLLLDERPFNPSNTSSLLSLNKGQLEVAEELSNPQAPKRVDCYRKHICSSLKSIENVMKQNLQEVIITDEVNLNNTISEFDNLAASLLTSKQELLSIQEKINCDYKDKLQGDFDDENTTSFSFQLHSTIQKSATDLVELEQKMNHYKNKLREQKQTIKRLEDWAHVESSLQEAKRSIRPVYKYRFLLVDLFIAALFIYILSLLKTVFL